MYQTEAFGVRSATSKFERLTISRNEPGADDVQFDLLYCGVCHTDVHMTRGHLGSANYPMVPGHELAGVVTKVGANVKGYKVGDKVGVGCVSDSCLKCEMCDKGEEQICLNGYTMTYGTQIKHDHLKTDTGYTHGGYSGKYTVHERFLVRIPADFPLEFAGPIFCAGITMYTPLKKYGCLTGGKRVGVIGIGGLGQMGIRLAVAMGNEVTAISTSPAKEATARAMGAKHFVVSSDPESMKAAESSLDVILNTVSANHQASDYFKLLRVDGAQVLLGLTTQPHQVPALTMLMKRISLSGSGIGGMIDTQEVMDFCYAKGIKPEIEVITADKLDEVFDNLDGKNDSIKRYVIDIKKSLA